MAKAITLKASWLSVSAGLDSQATWIMNHTTARMMKQMITLMLVTCLSKLS
jgi:hypothetical protein